MSKGLKALEDLMSNYYEMCEDTGNNDDQYQRCNLTSERAIIEKELENYDEIEQMCEQYNIEFNLVNIRHALFTLAQLKGSNGTNWENYNRKLEALEIIKEKEVVVSWLLFDGLEVYNENMHSSKVLTKEEYELLKEVFKDE
jgi:hypothetical protein